MVDEPATAEQQDKLYNLKVAATNELRDYGQYLAMRGAEPGEQRFGLPEVGLAVTSLAAWSLGSYVKSYLEEKGRLHAESRHRSARKDIAEQLDQLERALRESRTSAESAEDTLRQALEEVRRWGRPPITMTLDEIALAEELRRMGLTRRAARDLAPRLARILAENLRRALMAEETSGNDDGGGGD